MLLIEMGGSALTWLVQGVKRVTEDFSGAMPILFSLAQSAMGMKESERRVAMEDASREMSGRVTAKVTSSAYEAII